MSSAKEYVLTEYEEVGRVGLTRACACRQLSVLRALAQQQALGELRSQQISTGQAVRWPRVGCALHWCVQLAACPLRNHANRIPIQPWCARPLAHTLTRTLCVHARLRVPPCCLPCPQQRLPHLPVLDDSFVELEWSELNDGQMKCTICMDMFTQTRTTKECLHRFCHKCIQRYAM